MRPSHIDLHRYVDKINAKECAAAAIGQEYVIPTIAIIDPAHSVDIDSLPNQFVIKANHNSGTVALIRDKTDADLPSIIKAMQRSLTTNYYHIWRELPYKLITPKLFIEPLISEDPRDLTDYKFFCFKGQPKFFFIAQDRHSPDKKLKFDFYDMNLEKLAVTQEYDQSDYGFKPPANFNKMIEIATRLSAGFEHVRIDLYSVKGQIYFGEYTFYHFSGLQPFRPRDYDFVLGKLWE